jgi:hypothetical protein
MTCLLLALAAATLAAAGAENLPDEFKMSVSGWSFTRERKTINSSNRVTATFTVKNVTKATVEELKFTAILQTGTGEVVGTLGRKEVDPLKPGDSRRVTMVGDFIPIFSSYRVLVEYKGGREEWRANWEYGQPEPKESQLIKGLAVVSLLGQEADVDKRGRFGGTMRVQNEGTLEAKQLKYVFTFLDNKGQKITECTGLLGDGSLAGGTEKNIPFTVPDSPRGFANFRVNVVHKEAAAATALDFAYIADVEFAKIIVLRGQNKTDPVKITGQVRNGLAVSVDQVKISLAFRGPKKVELKRLTSTLPAALKPGEVQPVEFTLPDLAEFVSYEPGVEYVKLDQGGVAVPAEAPKFKNLPEIEVIFTQAKTEEDKSVTLLGAMRNGRDAPIKDVCITVTFSMPKGPAVEGKKLLAGIAQPGEVMNFVLKTPAAAGFSNYTYNFKCAAWAKDISTAPDSGEKAPAENAP